MDRDRDTSRDGGGEGAPDKVPSTLVFRSMLSDLDSVRETLALVVEQRGGQYVNLDRCTAHLDSLVAEIESSMPYRECPMCQCSVGDCRACGNSGWVSRLRWECIPEEFKKE